MKKRFIIIFTFLVLVSTAIPVLATGSLVETTAAGYAKGDYSLSYVREYMIYLTQIILSLVGVLSLVAFVIGGSMFLISGGSNEKIKKGKDIITAAVIGIIITFSGVFILNTFFKGIGITWNTSTGEIPSVNTNK